MVGERTRSARLSLTKEICARLTSMPPRIWPIQLKPGSPSSNCWACMVILRSNSATLAGLSSTCSLHPLASALASSKMHHARVSAAGPDRTHPASGSPCSASKKGCGGAAHDLFRGGGAGGCGGAGEEGGGGTE